MLTHLDLFSGIGGFALAAQWAGFRTVGFCEIDPYCQRVLAKNFLADAELDGCERSRERTNANGTLRATGETAGEESEAWRVTKAINRRDSRARIYSDIFDFDGTRYRGVDLITGGFPCQPFSVAGKRRGAADDRHLWPEMLRVIGEARPAWVLGENVPGIIPMELDNVLSQLEAIGYACRPFVIPACAVDARHRRDRLWIVGRLNGGDRRADECGNTSRAEIGDRSQSPFPNSYGARCEGSERTVLQGTSRESFGHSLQPEILADSERGGQSGSRKSFDAEHSKTEGNGQATESWNGCGPALWSPEPDVGRVAHGIPARVDRLRGLGNAIVPQVAFEILRGIRSSYP